MYTVAAGSGDTVQFKKRRRGVGDWRGKEPGGGVEGAGASEPTLP